MLQSAEDRSYLAALEVVADSFDIPTDHDARELEAWAGLLAAAFSTALSGAATPARRSHFPKGAAEGFRGIAGPLRVTQRAALDAVRQVSSFPAETGKVLAWRFTQHYHAAPAAVLTAA